MRVVLLLMLWAGALVAGGHGVTARFVPEQVRPGEVFELRVEMARAEYGHFTLKVPPHGSLHRVAVESEPLRLVDGLYRQAERWILQADRAGEIVIENAVVTMTTGDGEQAVALPPLRVEVMPWGAVDQSPEPTKWPAPPDSSASRTESGLWWVLLGLVGFAMVAWFIGRKLVTKPKFVTPGMPLENLALSELDAGVLQSAALERLLLEKGREWSAELRDVVSEAAYAGRGDPREVAEMLRREVGRFEPERTGL